MTDLRQAATLALEALKYASTGNRRPEIIGPAINALRTALEQQAEPVAWPQLSDDMEYAAQDEFHILPPRMKRLWKRLQELYTTPLQRKPLTAKEINALPEAKGYWPIGMNDRIVRLIRAVEAAHGIKEGT